MKPTDGLVLTADILVIGSGPGGAITACLLAEAGRDVLLIEEGSELQQSSAGQFSSAEMAQKYRNGGITIALGKGECHVCRGTGYRWRQRDKQRHGKSRLRR